VDSELWGESAMSPYVLQKRVVGSPGRSDARQELFVPMPVFARR
jgi:hypothetical protein